MPCSSRASQANCLNVKIKQIPLHVLMILRLLLSSSPLFCLDPHTLCHHYRCAGMLHLSLGSFPSLSNFQSVPGLMQPTTG